MPSELNKVLSLFECKSPTQTAARFCDDSEFYLEVVSQMLSDPGFDELGKQLTARNTAAAFEAAHGLKGIIGNCDITPMYKLIVQIVEPLRNGNADFGVLESAYSQLLCARE